MKSQHVRDCPTVAVDGEGCPDCNHLGWIVSESIYGRAVEYCQACNRLRDDDAAAFAAGSCVGLLAAGSAATPAQTDEIRRAATLLLATIGGPL